MENVATAGEDDSLFGFWVYLMTDLVIFAVLFATFTVLRNNTFGGPSGRELFSLPSAVTETLLLLTSSFTCGLAAVAFRRGVRTRAIIWFAVTFALGAAFLARELGEFSGLAAAGAGWQRSAFLSSFFTLVGAHGLHIAVGLLWMAVVMVQIWFRGLSAAVVSKAARLALFWHFLDVVWIFIFSVVYLMSRLV